MSKPDKQYFENVLAALQETEEQGLLSNHRDDGLSGLAGLKTVGALQRLAQLMSADETACYLEIGVFQGLTLVSTALDAPDLPCFGIDNFRILDPNDENLSIVQDRMTAFKTKNAKLINMDFEAALETLEDHIGNRKVGLYLIDGPHDYRSQLVCLLLAKRHLHDRAVIVIDDANYPDVRMATRDFLLSHPDFKMVFEAYSPAHPANMEPEERAKWEAGWLNGVNILVHDPDGLFPDLLPPIVEDRTLYFNEWLVHRLRVAGLAPKAVALADALCSGESTEAAALQTQLLEQYQKDLAVFQNRDVDRNVCSAGLPINHFNELN
ncbi:MAG: class I SAM-dependent methyltransferase [Rhodospirillales bacterium]|nr:class I SAM-dependent methyltransferase [Rhodospirillales bacterium]MBT8005554.1 class I SAM-dependent methyltransferase [Rhodospirillales bacterium]